MLFTNTQEQIPIDDVMKLLNEAKNSAPTKKSAQLPSNPAKKRRTTAGAKENVQPIDEVIYMSCQKLISAHRCAVRRFICLYEVLINPIINRIRNATRPKRLI